MVSTGNAVQGVLVAFVSGGGGVGKSAMALVAAHLAARAGIDTALVECDLQFGDMGFWLDMDEESSTLADGLDARPVSLADGLAFYKAPCFPELAEEVEEDVAALVEALRRRHSLVIADSGSFWSGLTANLAVHSDACIIVADARPESVASACRANELLGRIGVPRVRRALALNRSGAKARVDAATAAKALGLDSVHAVPDGKKLVGEMLCAGDVTGLVGSGNAFVAGVSNMLAAVLPRAGCAYAPAVAPGKRRWLP